MNTIPPRKQMTLADDSSLAARIPILAKCLWLKPLFILLFTVGPLSADQFGDFTYTNNTTHVTITGYTGSGGAVVIPSTIVGLSVTVIGNSAFQFKSSITSVVIPATVTTIQNFAFSHITGLTSIFIPSSVTTIGDYVLYACSGLLTISVDAANPAYSSNDGVLFNKTQTSLIQYPSGKGGTYSVPSGVSTILQNAFAYMSGLISVSFPASVTTIQGGVFTNCNDLTSISVNAANPSYSTSGGVLFNKSQTILLQYPPGKSGSYAIPTSVSTISQYAFGYCDGLTAVTIPTSVTTIDNSAFFDCAALANLSIPASVTFIGGSAFRGCASLTAIAVDAANPSYSSPGGVLFNKLQTTLIQYPGGKNGGYSIPSGVIIIGVDAFIGCYGLTSVAIPSGVTTIGSQAFHSTGLSSVTFPSSLTSLEFFAFAYCYSLTSATFEGNAPTFGGSVFQSPGSGFKVYFFSGATGFTTPTWQGYPSQMLTGGGGSALADAVDAASLTFTTGGSASWGSQTVVTHDGMDAAASGDIGNSQESWMETTVTGPGTISFWWAAATDPNDVLGFFVNGVQQSGPISGNVPWAQKTYVLGAGTQTLRWRYSKDFFGDFYSDTAWVDQVSWTPGGGGNPTDLTWSSNGSSITITGYTGIGGAVVIPSTIDGLPVTTIGAYAFDSKFAVTGVTIPSSVTSIGSYAFLSCSNLASVTIPSSVTSIGFQAFSYCYSLTSVSISSGLTNIGSGAFSGCNSLPSFSVDPANPTYSASGGVLFNKTQTTLIQYPGGKSGAYTIPSSVTSIGSLAFQYSIGLTGVTIPSGVTSIDADAFRGCSILTSISVDVANPSYSASGGVLFNKAQTILIQYPAGKTGGYSIPSGVTSIGASAFYSCTGLTSITIPSSTTSIGSFAFYFCTGLTSVTMPSGVAVVDAYAFYYCNKLTSVTLPSSVTSIATSAFRYCALLASVTFQGNAPATFGTTVFGNTAAGFTVYYYSGPTGFTSPTWQGYPSQMLAAGNSFTSWASAAGLTGNNSLPGAIPFGDGVPNLLKYAFGLNATGPDVRRMVQGGTVGLPASYMFTQGSTVWRVEYLRRKNSGLTYTPKKSTTLVGGSFVPLTGTPVVSEIVGFPDWERVIVDEPYNPATTPKMFTTVEVIGE